MKKYKFFIDSYQAEWIFSPIRSKFDSLRILLKTVKLLLVNNQPGQTTGAGEITLIISKMSRIFFISEGKIFSIAFPFFVTCTDGIFALKSYNNFEINSKVSSEILSLLENSDITDSNEILSFVEPIFDVCDTNPELWSLFKSLMLHEDGYIRYDIDEAHQNKHLHPLNHFDVFYSNNVTFKLGLKDRIKHTDFLDMLMHDTNCHYVCPIK